MLFDVLCFIQEKGQVTVAVFVFFKQFLFFEWERKKNSKSVFFFGLENFEKGY